MDSQKQMTVCRSFQLHCLMSCYKCFSYGKVRILEDEWDCRMYVTIYLRSWNITKMRILHPSIAVEVAKMQGILIPCWFGWFVELWCRHIFCVTTVDLIDLLSFDLGVYSVLASVSCWCWPSGYIKNARSLCSRKKIKAKCTVWLAASACPLLEKAYWTRCCLLMSTKL